MRIRGVYPPIVTPFDEQGRVFAHALKENVRRWNETGLAGYVVAGSNGEGALLALDEFLEVLRIVRRTALPGMLVIAGTGRQSTQETILWTRAAADEGADAVLVVTPFFYGRQMTGEALRRHYEAVADASPVPLLIYNVPKFTHLNISPTVVAGLASHEKIIGIKDSAGDIGQLIDLVRLCPPNFDVLVGNGPAFLSGLQVGASGGILALANVAPRECVSIWRWVSEGQLEQAKALHFRLMEVARAVTSGYGVPGLKAAMDLLGYYGGPPRPPLLAVTDEVRAVLERLLRKAGLKE